MFKNLFGKKENVQPVEVKEIPAVEVKTDQNYELFAAIGFALHTYVAELHDYEKTVLTIKKVMRPYSPWSSKIYGLRKSPR